MGIGTALRRAVGLETKAAQPLSLADEKAARIWQRVFGIGETSSGKAVTVDTAMQLSAVWACVRLISETVATLPLMLYRRHPDGGREVASEHPLYTLLHDSPNADMTAVEFIEGLVLSICLNGNAFAEKVRRGDGTVIALLPLAVDKVTVRRDEIGAREYRITEKGGYRTLGEDDVLHVRGFGNGSDVGLSPISYARQTLGIAMAADEAAGKMFANGVRPSGVVEVPQVLTEPQRKDARDNIITPMAGSKNAGSVFMLEAGWKFTPVQISPKDAEMATTRRWHVEEIARWFGVPPILIGHASEGQTMWGTGVEQINLAWLQLGLRGYLKRIEVALGRSLILPQDRGDLSFEFVVEGLLRADSKTRFSLYSVQAQNGLMTRNEMRALENLPPVEGGDVLTVQANLLPIDMLGKVKPAATPDPKPEDDEEDGPDGRGPFDETKAFDPSKHPRDENGMFKGRGAKRARLFRLARLALANGRHDDNADIGRVVGARFSGAAGRDVDGWRFGLTAQHVRHIGSRHGPGSNDRNPITSQDYGHLPAILSKGHVTTGGLTRREKLPTVIVSHRIGRTNFRVVLTVRKRHRTLMLQTFTKG